MGRLLIKRSLLGTLLGELHLRTQGVHESGAFMLGAMGADGRQVEEILYYDDLDPQAYRTGVVILHADSFGRLWETCRAKGLQVVADVHVHQYGAGQSIADRTNPMIALSGHLAMILPNFAVSPIAAEQVGFYEYLGSHRWRSLGGRMLFDHLILQD